MSKNQDDPASRKAETGSLGIISEPNSKSNLHPSCKHALSQQHQQSHPSAESSASSGQTFAHALVTRCRALLSEIDTLKTLLAETQRNPQIVEVRSLRSNVLSELKTLEKLSAQLGAGTQSQSQSNEAAAATRSYLEENAAENIEPTDSYTEPPEAELRVTHALRSSNLPFYEAVWAVAKKSCTGLVAFGKRFYWDGEGEKEKDKKKAKRKSVFVDIVADDGEEWVKVSTISETRLLFEMAKKGWEGDSEDSEDGEERTVLQNHGEDEDSDYSGDDDDEIELLKLAADMRKAASLVTVNYRRPRLRFMMPKVEEGSSPEIDDLLKAIRGYGVVVKCGEEVFASQTDAANDNTAEVVSVQEEIQCLLPNRFKRFTPTLNVDCTLLLAIISDLSHFNDIAPSLKHHKAINRQIEIERERPLLLTELWPAMQSHHLVCTSEAARRMREIVETIGTDTERKRMTILMGDQSSGGKSASLIEELQELSDYHIPSQLDLPIEIVKADDAIKSRHAQAKLPPVAQKVEEILSDINKSVFIYGWVSGIMTVTSNRTVTKQIENLIESQRDGEDLQGPLIWVCDTARSLIGKEKGRRS